MFSQYATSENWENKSEWHNLRGKGIGGSDCSIILMDNPYKSKTQLWREKKGLVKPEDVSNKPAVIKGTLMEDHLRSLFSLEHPEYEIIYDNKTYFSIKYPFMLANLDGVIKVKATGELIGLEIKTANVRSVKEWDEIPLHYYEQIQHYMAVTGLKKFILYAYIKTPYQVYLKEYLISADEADQEYIIIKETEFVESLKSDIEPTNQVKIKF
ncbi:YqaJ viral recombinase family protein [Caviibacter abscessus]|uniref:YqaJ viral recombinase family protein n=1 Tax=Caviibacter abscessus TaxID=1766719 RepID=UPI0008384F1D|nr:YqaJ viral recombinase family protein [Caviibacter abscessus]